MDDIELNRTIPRATVHIGPYETLGETYRDTAGWSDTAAAPRS